MKYFSGMFSPEKLCPNMESNCILAHISPKYVYLKSVAKEMVSFK